MQNGVSISDLRAGTLEMGVILKMNSGQCKLEPDPVRIIYSVREGLTVKRHYVMCRDVVVGVNGSVDT
jgi:hypothetical protein